MAIKIGVEVDGNAGRGLEDLKRKLVDLIQRVKALGEQAKSSNKNIESGFNRSSISGRELTKTIAKISSGLLTVGGIGVRTFSSIAEKTKETNAESRAFLIAIENFKKRYDEFAQTALPIINKFLNLTQVAATELQKNNATIAAIIENYKKLRDTRTPAEERWLKIHDQVLENLKEEKQKREEITRVAKQQADEAARAARDEARAINEATQALKQLSELERQSTRDEARESNELLRTRQELLNTLQELDREEREAETEKALEAQKKKAEDLQRAYYTVGQIGATAFSNIANKIDTTDAPLLDLIKNLSVAAINFALFGGSGGFLSTALGFKHGGVIPQDVPHAQRGLIVRRPTLVATGENSQPEAIVPLAQNRARDRARVLNEAGLNAGGNVTVNLNLPNVSFLDPVTLRNRIMPEINRQVRRGERLVSSSTL